MDADYRFTNEWFEAARRAWDAIVADWRPSRILEIGSYEGRGSCYFIDAVASNPQSEVHCVDTWEGGIEHGDIPMGDVEQRFHHNTRIALENTPKIVKLKVHKGQSDRVLARLLAEGYGEYFDVVYVDGSHQAPDVLCDAVLGFRLVRVGGLMAFDDYLWAEVLPGGRDPLRCPRPAIDAFYAMYFRKLRQLPLLPIQVYFEKTAA